MLASGDTAVSMGSADHRYNLAEILSHDYSPRREVESPESHKSFEDLERDSDMPLEELLALYGYEASDPISEHESEGSSPSELADNLPDMTLDKEQIAKDLLSGEEEEETQSSADDLTPSVTSHDASDLFRHPLRYEDEDTEEDDSILANDCKKVSVYLRARPHLYSALPRIYDNDDQLLWDPYVLPEKQVEEFLHKALKRMREEKTHESLLEGALVKNSEQALYELVKCNFNVEEALRRLRFNVKVVRRKQPFHLGVWSPLYLRSLNVRTRSVGECVAYYYVWKKSERYSYFAQQTKFGKKKYKNVDGAVCGMSAGTRMFEYGSSPANSRSGSHCPLDPTASSRDCDLVSSLNQQDSGFFQLELDRVILDRPQLEMTAKKLTMDFSRPKAFGDRLPGEDRTSHIAQAKMSVAVTDFGSIDVGDMNSLLSAHSLHHTATLHSESLSQ
uniref:MIER family member 2 n=1 Tax=Callorhinchus milii TaxID=7868 RepID=A0A4W3HGF0_CALMI